MYIGHSLHCSTKHLGCTCRQLMLTKLQHEQQPWSKHILVLTATQMMSFTASPHWILTLWQKANT